MKLIIAEKPSVAMEIAKVVGSVKREEGFVAGAGYLVSWCVGHLVSLAMPETYEEKLKTWRIEDLPILPKEFKTTVLSGTAKQFSVLKKLMEREDVDELICATDAGREGELIFRLVYEKAGCHKPFKRLWVSSLEKSAIEKALQCMKGGKEYDNLYYAARCRQRADWLIGMNFTRLYTVKYGTTLNTGRVQTPTIQLLVKRQQEIDEFIPVPYYNLFAEMNEVEAMCRIENQQQAYDSMELIRGKNAVVKSVLKEQKKENPPKLYDLTALQREANQLFGFSAKQTLDIAQNLYEMKIITYPRTDSRYLTSDMQESTKELIAELSENFSSWLPENVNFRKVNTDKLVNDKKVSDHHALLPTKYLSQKYKELPTSEQKIAALILFRLFESVSPSYLFESTKIEFDVENLMLTAKGNTVKEKGYRHIKVSFLKHFLPDQTDKQKDVILPDLQEGDILCVNNSRVEEKKTQPPKPYTEDTLLAAMETAGRKIEDEELKEAMKDSGLGTPATRAETIESLFKNGYAVRNKKNILSTDTAKKYISLVADEVKQAELTAKWEKQLAEIAQGVSDETSFMQSITSYIQDVIQKEKQTAAEVQFERKKPDSYGKCPVCGGDVLKRPKSFTCASCCGFVVWKTICGKELTENAVKRLLEKGETNLIKGFVSKAGKKFNACLTVEENGNIKFIFPKK